MAQYRIKSLNRTHDNRGYEVIFEVTPSWLGRLLGMKARDVTYHGSSSVWRIFPSGERVGTSMERFIGDMVAGYLMRQTKQ